MQLLELRGHHLFIGAAIPLNHIARHPLTATYAQALVEACDLVGGPQVRNVATLGGNVAHALPAADGTIALLALDAEAEIASALGLRRLPFGELFLGPGKSALKHGEELLVGFYIKVPGGAKTGTCFKRIMRPQGVALPIINLAVWLEREGDCVKDVHLAVGPGAATPFRSRGAEAALRGRVFDAAALSASLEALLAEVKFRSSARRAGADYRRHLVASLSKETLEAAWQRAE
jgi:carbon-monoxide dehydrogenase medium subunit